MHDAQYASGAVAFLHTVFLCVGSQFAETRHLSTQLVDVAHGEVGTCLLCHSQQVEHGVGAASHGYVESHGIEQSLTSGYAAWQHALVAIVIVCHGISHDEASCIAEELHPVGVCGQYGAVARQRQTYGLSE